MRSFLSTAVGALGLALMLAACTPMTAKTKTAPPEAVALAPKQVATAAMPAAKPVHHRVWKHHHRWKRHHAWKRHHHAWKHRHYAWKRHHKWRHWHWRHHRFVRLPRRILHPYHPPPVTIDERF